MPASRHGARFKILLASDLAGRVSHLDYSHMEAYYHTLNFVRDLTVLLVRGRADQSHV